MKISGDFTVAVPFPLAFGNLAVGAVYYVKSWGVGISYVDVFLKTDHDTAMRVSDGDRVEHANLRLEVRELNVELIIKGEL